MVCNLAITLIHQTDVFLRKFIERAKDDFLKNGGIREQMTKARILNVLRLVVDLRAYRTLRQFVGYTFIYVSERGSPLK